MGRRVLVTAALPYANGELHIGHLKSTYLPADIYVRYLKLRGVDAIYVCGSDQHGTPIEIAARGSGMSPEEYADYWWRVHQRDFERMRIEFDVYYKTHSAENMELTKHFLLKARERGFLYEREVKQLYCAHDRIFLADRYVLGRCPRCGAEDQYGDHCEVCGSTYEAWELLEPRCALCGGRPEVRSSTHLFFKLSAFRDKLRKYINENSRFQREVVNYLNRWIEEGLRDWDITREENYWGIEMPFEDVKGKRVYVWFDAPIGYIAATVKWARDNGKRWKDYWKDPGSEIVHFIGKDIVYHHFLFWPAMLMSTGEFNLPSAIVVRGFLLLEGRKFSKSRKWYIPIGEAIKIVDPDYLRFYLTYVTPASLEDTDFKIEDFRNIVNSSLSDTIGNMVHRVVTLVHRFFEGRTPAPGRLDSADEELVSLAGRTLERYAGHMESFDFKAGLEDILGLSRAVNKYLNVKEPWARARSQRGEAAATLYVALDMVAKIAVLLYPFTPRIAEKIWRIVRGEEPMSFDSIKKRPSPGTPLGKPEIVAPRITEEQVDRLNRLLGR